MPELEVRVTPKHVWVAVATYRLTPEQAEAALTNDGVQLEPDTVIGIMGPVCYHCEQVYGQHAPVCPAAATTN